MKPTPPLESLILTLRGHKVMLDADLAELYGVPTKVFNQAVKRNADRFPEDFMFQLTAQEWANLRSQIVTSSSEVVENEDNELMWSQIVTTSKGRSSQQNEAGLRPDMKPKSHGGPRYLPFAFTEHGAIMAATVLNSPQAVAMSIYVVRAFMQMREQLAANAAILKRLAEIDKTLLEHDSALRAIWTKLQPLLAPPPEKPKKRMGF